MSVRGFILGRIYRALRGFSKWHEEHEILITVCELAIALIGVTLFANELFEFIELPPGAAFVQGGGEVSIFCLLTASITARLAIIMRERNLGSDFGSLFSGPKPKGELSSDERLLHKLLELGPPNGFLGSVISQANDTRKAVLDHIARESASQFSIRTYGEADPMWKSWEERYLSDWLSAFPAAIWRLPPDGPGSEANGYFSIVVPVTEDAWKKVRYGHLSTALCALDQPAVDYFNSARVEPYGRPLFLVFYTLIYVPTGGKGESWKPVKLLYGGIEHLAYLISQFHPVPCTDAVSMSLVCESPNASLEAVLHTLGFAAVHTDFDLELEHTHIRKSVAGFNLFEISYQHGSVTIGDRRKGEGFLDLLCEIGRRDPTPRPPMLEIEPDSEMTMVHRRTT